MNTPIVSDNVNKMWADPRFQILAEVDKLLNSNRVWKGMEWSYGYIHPHQYRPVAEKVHQALDDLQKEYGLERMNERIKQFEKQCWDHQVNHLDTEKFAELIVRECITVINQPNGVGDDDVIRITKDVEKHFGVEE